jgi:hypothetical protein
MTNEQERRIVKWCLKQQLSHYTGNGAFSKTKLSRTDAARAEQEREDFLFSQEGTKWVLAKLQVTPQEALVVARSIRLCDTPRSVAKNKRVLSVIQHLEALSIQPE